MYTPSQAYEFALLFIAIYREARGEPDDGKVAVAWVIRNRALRLNEKWYGTDWISVILKPKQFSAFNANDPNSDKFPQPNDPGFGPCMLVAKRVYEGLTPDPTFGSTYYHVASMPEYPAWAKDMQFTVHIGNHRFYRQPKPPVVQAQT